MALRYFLSELHRVRLMREHEKYSLKKYKNWYKKLEDFDVPNKIQSGEYSMDGGGDGFLYESGCVLRAVNVNWNDDSWNVNANSIDDLNKWNEGNQILSRNCCIFLLLNLQEFCFASPFSNPLACAQFPKNGAQLRFLCYNIDIN